MVRIFLNKLYFGLPEPIRPARPLVGNRAYAGYLIEWMKLAAVCLVLAVFLLGDSHLFNWQKDFGGALSLNFSAAETQWMMFACAGGYFAIFSLLQYFSKAKQNEFRARPAVFLAATLLVGALAYAFDYPAASSTPRALIFVFGAAVGKGVELWFSSLTEPAQIKRFFLRLIIPLLLLLVASCLSKLEPSMIFQYRGQTRWTGFWHDPNRYGLLMGLGLNLLAGLWLAIFHWPYFRRLQRTAQVGWLALLTAVTVIMGMGLLNSFSRGGWLGTAVGFGGIFLAIGAGANNPTLCWLRRNGAIMALLLLALAVLTFWQFNHSEQRVARRSFSAANANDISWRNRVAAWEGACQIMAERPWLGAGWNQANLVYDRYYRPDHLTDFKAIQTNDFTLFGAMLGVPALTCFLAWVGLTLMRSFQPEVASVGEINPSDFNQDLMVARYLQAGCLGGALVLLVGFWFDGGLFVLSTALMFWILLKLGRAPLAGGGKGIPSGPGEKSSGPFLKFFIGILLLVLGAMAWAKSDDSFQRGEFTGKTIHQEKLSGIAVFPKGAQKCPVVIYAHAAGEAWRTDGNALRQFAELGFAAVGFDYDVENPTAFEDQFSATLAYVKQQPQTDTQAIAWVGSGLGADNVMRYALGHPENQPQLLVRVSGGTIPELEMSSPALTALHSHVLLIHGERDETFSVEAVRKQAETLRRSGVVTTLKIIPGAVHGLDGDLAQTLRLTGEFSKAQLTAVNPLPEFPKVHPYPIWLCLLPVIGWAGFWVWQKKSNLVGVMETADRVAPKWTKWEMRLRVAAVCFLVLAAAQTAFRLILPRLAVTEKTLALARSSFVPAKWKDDFTALSSQPIWQGQKVKTLLENVELSHYTVNELINWPVEPDKYRDYVLSPVIAEDRTELNWRRELWDNFYRRVRKENSTASAAEIVVRFLRERVTVSPGYPKQRGVESIWSGHVANPDDFEIVYTAALRSVGVPARLTVERQTEFWSGSGWKLAPRPIALTWVETGAAKKTYFSANDGNLGNVAN